MLTGHEQPAYLQAGALHHRGEGMMVFLMVSLCGAARGTAYTTKSASAHELIEKIRSAVSK